MWLRRPALRWAAPRRALEGLLETRSCYWVCEGIRFRVLGFRVLRFFGLQFGFRG